MMRRHRSFLIALPALLALPLSLPSLARAQIKVDDRQAVTPTASILISGGFGELRIIGWDKDSVIVTGSIPKGARFQGGFGRMSNGGPASGMKMFLEMPDELPASLAKLEMRVPSRARVWVKGGSTVLTASGVTGALDLSVIGGSVQITGSPRELTIGAMDANVRIEGSPEWARVKTATGDITFVGGSNDTELSTVSGTIKLGGGAVERAKLESVTGPVVFAGDLVKQGSLDVNTHSGAIEIDVPRSLSADFDVASMIGTIDNALTGRAAVPGREGRGQEIGLRVGNGSARVYVRTFKGTVTLRAAK
jgi:DUF4097 and DUF4098 domain-containing protein YvlB